MKDLSDDPYRRPFAPPGSTASTLMEGFRSNSEGAWKGLIALYAPFVYRCARRFGLGPEDAADVGQEVFRAVAANFSRFRRDRTNATFRGWLCRITAHKAIDFRRRERLEPRAIGGDQAQALLLAIDAPNESEADAPLPAFGELFHRTLAQIRDGFEPSTWAAFWLTVIEGRPVADVASDLKISRNAVYVARLRVLRRLREELGDQVP